MTPTKPTLYESEYLGFANFQYKCFGPAWKENQRALEPILRCFFQNSFYELPFMKKLNEKDPYRKPLSTEEMFDLLDDMLIELRVKYDNATSIPPDEDSPILKLPVFPEVLQKRLEENRAKKPSKGVRKGRFIKDSTQTINIITNTYTNDVTGEKRAVVKMTVKKDEPLEDIDVDGEKVAITPLTTKTAKAVAHDMDKDNAIKKATKGCIAYLKKHGFDIDEKSIFGSTEVKTDKVANTNIPPDAPQSKETNNVNDLNKGPKEVTKKDPNPNPPNPKIDCGQPALEKIMEENINKEKERKGKLSG